jgi:membrane-associated phospholipid phosphatase
MTFHISPATQGFIDAIDRAGTSMALSAQQGGGLTQAMRFLTAVFDPMIVLVASCVIVALFLIRSARAKKTGDIMKEQIMRFQASRFLLSILAISALVWAVKHLAARIRPVEGLIPETGFSFPSGHAAVSLVFFSILYMSFAPYMRNIWLKRTAFAFTILLPLCIGASRVYLGVHYLSDVLGGFIFGAIVVALAMLLGERYRRRFGQF